MKLLLVLVGIATYYNSSVGSPLYCDDGTGHLYDPDAPPWVALSEELYKIGWAKCGDKIKVVLDDGTSFTALAMDAGPLQDYFLEESPELPLLVDVPQHLWPRKTMSSLATVVNLTTVAELFEQLTK